MANLPVCSRQFRLADLIFLGNSLIWACITSHYLVKQGIAAFARQQQAILVHKDPESEVLAKELTQEILPYK